MLQMQHMKMTLESTCKLLAVNVKDWKLHRNNQIKHAH